MSRAMEQIEAWALPFVIALLIGVLGYNWVQMDSRVAQMERALQLGCAALR